MSTHKTISLCLIALNEEEFIGRALENTAPSVDEIIVVDGGSTDRTVDIARQHGARVYHHPWNDHFSKQRNHALSYATKDWILVMDPDETHEPALLEGLQHFATNDFGIDLIVFPRKNFIDGQLTDVYPDWQFRFFKNGQGIAYKGRLHERPYGWTLLASPFDKHIIHAKTSIRQELQNKRYNTLEAKFGQNDRGKDHARPPET